MKGRIRVRIYLKGEYVFQDEFESKVIDKIILGTNNLTYIKEENNKKCYKLKEENVSGFKEELMMEKQRQWEKGLFKKQRTRTFKEIDIIIKIIRVMEEYLANIEEEEEDVIIFKVGVQEEQVVM